MFNASEILILVMAFTKMGAADLLASSAARFIDKIALSTSLPIPAVRSAVSTFFASGGINTLMAAFAKKPSAADNLLALFFAPTDNASFKPDTSSSLVNEVLPVVALPSTLLAFFNKLLCAKEATLERSNRGNT